MLIASSLPRPLIYCVLSLLCFSNISSAQRSRFFKKDEHKPLQLSLAHQISNSKHYLSSIENGLYKAPDLQVSHNFQLRFSKEYFLFGLSYGNSAANLSLAKYQDSLKPDPDCQKILEKDYLVHFVGLFFGYQAPLNKTYQIAAITGYNRGTLSRNSAKSQRGLFQCPNTISGGPDRRPNISPFNKQPQSWFLLLELQRTLPYNFKALLSADYIHRWEKGQFLESIYSNRFSLSLGLSYTLP